MVISLASLAEIVSEIIQIRLENHNIVLFEEAVLKRTDIAHYGVIRDAAASSAFYAQDLKESANVPIVQAVTQKEQRFAPHDIANARRDDAAVVGQPRDTLNIIVVRQHDAIVNAFFPRLGGK